MLTKFLSSADAEWDKILPFACYCFNTTPTADDLESPFFLVCRRDPLEGCTRLLGKGSIRLLGKGSIRYLGDNKGLILFADIHKLCSAHTKALEENGQLKTEKVKNNKHFEAHNFKVGQLIAVKIHLRNTSESIFISDYRVLEIVNEHTLLVKSPDGKIRQINISNAKPVSATAATDNTLQDFKLSAMKRVHTHPYMLWSSNK